MHEYSCCPSCQSDQWKSARLVVLEGTSTTNTRTEGALKDPGRLSGIRALMLSDRWFSWDHPITMNSESLTSTALAESVKHLMVAEGSLRPMPEKPAYPPAPAAPRSPQSITWFNRITPKEPKKREVRITLAEPKYRPWIGHFVIEFLRDGISSVLLVSLLAWLLARDYVYDLAGFIPWLRDWFESSDLVNLLKDAELTEADVEFCTGLMVIDSLVVAAAAILAFQFSRKRNKALRDAYEKRVKRSQMDQERSQSEYERDKAKFEDDVRLAGEQKRMAEADFNRFQRENQEYGVALRSHKDACSEIDRKYEREVYEVQKFRELLWERARVCTRCGNAYLGSLHVESS